MIGIAVVGLIGVEGLAAKRQQTAGDDSGGSGAFNLVVG